MRDGRGEVRGAVEAPRREGREEERHGGGAWGRRRNPAVPSFCMASGSGILFRLGAEWRNLAGRRVAVVSEDRKSVV